MSLIVPGFSQFLQGRPLLGLAHFVLACLLWCCGMGWIVHLCSYLNACSYEKQKEKDRALVQSYASAYMVASEEYGRKYDHGYSRQRYQ